jgi:uroporphyrinogen-III synthase
MCVFISSEIADDHPIAHATKQGPFELIAVPLIAFSPLHNVPTKPYDILFFSSPRSFEFGQQFMRPEVLNAAFSQGTAKFLPRTDWQGRHPGNPAQTALDFHAWAGNRRVLFPVSDRSLGSISAAFPENQKEEVPVYQTTLVPQKIKECSIYLFTSPSNVESFLLCNTLPSGAKVIAWGESTRSFLSLRGIESDFCRSDDETVDWVTLLHAWLNL